MLHILLMIESSVPNWLCALSISYFIINSGWVMHIWIHEIISESSLLDTSEDTWLSWNKHHRSFSHDQTCRRKPSSEHFNQYNYKMLLIIPWGFGHILILWIFGLILAIFPL